MEGTFTGGTINIVHWRGQNRSMVLKEALIYISNTEVKESKI
jgi:hypothetical protein